jgi:hypothetical protein
MEAGAMDETAKDWDWFRHIAASQNVHSRTVESPDAGECIFEVTLRVHIHDPGE